MIITDAELLEKIEAFLDRTGMAPTRFGRDAMREASLIESLRKGRSLSLANANRVIQFMVDHDASPDGAPVSLPALLPSTGQTDEKSGRVPV
jgi:hypothetical protein